MVKNHFIYYLKKLAFLFLCIIFLIIYYFSASNISRAKALIYPNFIMSILGVIIVWNIIGTILEARKELAEKEKKENIPKQNANHQKITKIVIFVSAVSFVFIGQILGFWITTLLYIFLLSYYLGIRNLKLLIPQTVVVTVILYGIFELWLNLGLPKGIMF